MNGMALRSSPHVTYTREEMIVLERRASERLGMPAPRSTYDSVVRERIECIAGNRDTVPIVREDAIVFLEKLGGRIKTEPDTLAAVLLYVASLTKRLPVMESEFTRYAIPKPQRAAAPKSYLQYDPYDGRVVAFREVYNSAKKLLRIQAGALLKPQDFVERFSSVLRLDDRTARCALEILRLAEERSVVLVGGMVPATVAIGALWAASCMTGQRRPQREFGRVAGISEVTVRSVHNKIRSRINFQSLSVDADGRLLEKA